MPVSTAISWLKASAAMLMIGFGLLVAFAAWPPLAGVTELFVDVLAWPPDGGQSLDATETRLMMAIGGGITAGWGVTVWLIADRLLPVDPALARSILLPAIIIWFVVDSTCSVLAGVPLNAIANAGFLACFLWPLLRVQPGAVAAPG